MTFRHANQTRDEVARQSCGIKQLRRKRRRYRLEAFAPQSLERKERNLYSEYFSARKLLWHDAHASATAFVFAVTAASSPALAASASSPAALDKFLASFENSAGFSQI